ncbi:uncharacterized protein LOC111390596 [Olea europaea var. sylvestris]|uniref:uncharacterized protein LOC111390596 n=1 Tax=Olea europaea var. sylvestris TaxID=158386 RepID=UPI000C1D6F63|nr:uncharacterized protein LOC111390596 [Olea europaea var. sylvestris]
MSYQKVWKAKECTLEDLMVEGSNWDVENLTFVTDRGKSIINGITEVFPEAHHGYCMYHIQGNLKTRYQGKGIVALFRRAAEAYSFEEFEKFMVEIDSKSHAAWEYLTEMGIEHWAQSHFSRRRYNMMTSNNAEREESQSCASVLTPAQEDKFFKTLDAARKLESFPCTHAVAVAMHKGFPPHTLCSVYYMTDYWRATYAETIFPVPNEIEWEVPDHILPLNNLLPPAIGQRTPRRIRTSKIPSIGEFPQPRKCGRYSATGHTRRYCTSQIPLHDNVTDV